MQLHRIDVFQIRENFSRLVQVMAPKQILSRFSKQSSPKAARPSCQDSTSRH